MEKLHKDENGPNTITKKLPQKKLVVCRDVAGMEVPHSMWVNGRGRLLWVPLTFVTDDIHLYSKSHTHTHVPIHVSTTHKKNRAREKKTWEKEIRIIYCKSSSDFRGILVSCSWQFGYQD